MKQIIRVKCRIFLLSGAILLGVCLWGSYAAGAQSGGFPVSGKAGRGAFPLIDQNNPAMLLVSDHDFQGVIRAVDQFSHDLEMVAGKAPLTGHENSGAAKFAVIIGTIGESPLVDQLIARKKIDVRDVAGKWESSLIQVVHHPLPGIKKALVIAGSDKRGTIYGIYDVSSWIGVSPWYWWADIPVKKQACLYVKKGRYVTSSPQVKYRGIFINDEAPALSGWVHEKFGGFNHLFYEKVFELILRMRGNFLWPAMWGRAFYDDDQLNPLLADEYGIVIGTSHHEPMMRAHDEWRRYGSGPWNYRTNRDTLREFWRKGIIRKGSFESLVTVGMRGDGDEPMGESADIALLETIISDQRQIIGEITGKDAAETPQVWALYKEVQEYYDHGMQVPDDVTLLLCDDNWGNVRKLPPPGSPPRAGGYGIYYHFDYVGGPRNYKWLNTNPIPRVWEQMNLCFSHGVDRIWIVNVGDIKPMEFPIRFFLDMAWDPSAMTVERMADYSHNWAAENFGSAFADEIARMMDEYTRYNGRRKPELLDPGTYSLINYHEADRVVAAYQKLAKEALALNEKLPEEYRDAFFQLVSYPVQACANLNELYVTVGKNRLYAAQGRSATNDLAEKAEQLYRHDSLLTLQYNRELAGGKWNHMMDQTHIGYTGWQEPRVNAMPRVGRIQLPAGSRMRVAVEGSDKYWEEGIPDAVLPALDAFGGDSVYVDLFNAGSEPFDYSVETDVPWVIISHREGRVQKEVRVFFRADPSKVPQGEHVVPVRIASLDGNVVELQLKVFYPAAIPASFLGFVESNGCISMEAAHFSRKSDSGGRKWKEIPGLGRTWSGMTTLPAGAPPDTLPEGSPCLEYELWVFTAGEATLRVDLSPTLNYNGRGLRYAVALDNEKPQIVDMHGNYSNRQWEEWVRNNIIHSETRHTIGAPGKHILKIYSVDPGIVFQKIIVDTGGVKKSYLGPPGQVPRQL